MSSLTGCSGKTLAMLWARHYLTQSSARCKPRYSGTLRSSSLQDQLASGPSWAQIALSDQEPSPPQLTLGLGSSLNSILFCITFCADQSIGLWRDIGSQTKLCYSLCLNMCAGTLFPTHVTSTTQGRRALLRGQCPLGFQEETECGDCLTGAHDIKLA